MDLLKRLIALLVIFNPIAVIPFFTHTARGFSRVQRQVNLFPVLAETPR